MSTVSRPPNKASWKACLNSDAFNAKNDVVTTENALSADDTPSRERPYLPETWPPSRATPVESEANVKPSATP